MDEKNNLYILNNKFRKSRSISRQAFLKDSFEQCACTGAAMARMRTRAQVMALLRESLINAHVHRCCCLPVQDLIKERVAAPSEIFMTCHEIHSSVPAFETYTRSA